MAQRRIHALDALRGIAALWVVAYHVAIRYPYFMVGDDTPLTPLLPGHPGFFTAADMGTVPVLWFFIISGFVITWTIDRCRTPMDFVVSRFSRLFPAYWAAMAVSVVLALLIPLPGATPTLGQVLVNVTMLQDYLGIPPIDGVYWSLGVELRFYVFAFILFVLGQWRRMHLFALGWVLLALAVACANATGVWVPWRAQQLLVTRYAPLLGAGMMLYELWRGQRPTWSWATLAVASSTLFVAFNLPTALSCLVVMALIARSAQGGLRFLAFPPLLFLGTISYSLYLSHETTAFTVMRAFDEAGLPHLAGQLSAVAAAVLLATVISFGAERPGMRAIRRLWYRFEPPPSPTNLSHKLERS